jgi:solute carrier family 35 protein E3
MRLISRLELVADEYSQSGMLACLINLSQFLIINEAGPLSSTVVGHSKTCLIMTIGWITSGKSLSDGSLVGILLATGGIMA